MLTEGERARLLQGARGGCENALHALLSDYHPLLLAVVDRHLETRYQRYIDAEDILQETYITAFRCFGDCRFDGPAPFYSWLESITLTRLRDARRDLHRLKRDVRRNLHEGSAAFANRSERTSVVDLFGHINAGDSTPSAKLSRREMQAGMLVALARLTDEQRTVLRLRFLEERPAAEIATTLQKSEDAVYALCHRGLKSLRGYISPAVGN